MRASIYSIQHAYDDHIHDLHYLIILDMLLLGVNFILACLSQHAHMLRKPRVRHNANMTMLLPLLCQLLGQFHRPLIRVSKQEIDLLKRHFSCLRTKEVDKRCKDKVSAHEDQICLPLQAVDDDRGDHNNKEVLKV